MKIYTTEINTKYLYCGINKNINIKIIAIESDLNKIETTFDFFLYEDNVKIFSYDNFKKDREDIMRKYLAVVINQAHLYFDNKYNKEGKNIEYKIISNILNYIYNEKIETQKIDCINLK